MEFLTERDREILKLMSVFNGKMYIEVLAQTIWNGYPDAAKQARNRMAKLMNKYNIFILRKTGLMSPRNAYILSENGKDIVRTLFDKNITNISVSPITAGHNIMEMITYYWLNKLGKNPERTIVKNWSADHKHTPDIVYFKDDKPIYVEIEKNVKSAGAYNGIFAAIVQDKVEKVLYVVEDQKRVAQFANNLPLSEKIMLVSINELIINAQNNKIGAVSQKQARQTK